MGNISNSAKRTKRCILDAFTRILEVSSFQSLTVDDIAEEAAVSRSTFYKYFDSKYALAEFFFDNFKLKAKEKVIKILNECTDPETLHQVVTKEFNSNLRSFSTIRKVKDNYIDLEKELLTGIQKGISRHHELTEFEVEYLSNSLFWAWSFCFSLNRFVTVEEAAMVDERIDLVNILRIMATDPVPKN